MSIEITGSGTTSLTESQEGSELRETHKPDERIVAIVGLGYVGLPLAIEFGKIRHTIGFDISRERITELEKGTDRTLEMDSDQLRAARYLSYTVNPQDLSKAHIFIITVPTPIDQHKRPDLGPLLAATKMVAEVLKKGDLIIYESTVYPGCTEEKCVPLLEEVSGLSYNSDFFCGYSPERINPGDKERTLTKIIKVTSGSTPEACADVDRLYNSIITAGTYPVQSLKVAEASKAIENAQRDVNIAFVNELALIFDKVGIDTIEVLNAAGTKWNFLPFRPGLVGGHCIGVDPYYLAFKANSLGYQPDLINAARTINDNMGFFISNKVVKLMIQAGIKIKDADILVLGITFKENCPDIRNTRVVDIIMEMKDFGCNVHVYDPWADPDEVQREYGIELITNLDQNGSRKYPAIILAVAHNQFLNYDLDRHCHESTILFDIKGILNREDVTRL